MAEQATWWRRTGRSRALVVLQIVVTLALIGWLVTKIDRRALDAALALDPWIACAAVLVFASAQIWGGLRLHALVPDRKVTAGEAIRATFVGYFFANFLPGTVGGDVVRGIRLKSAGVGLGELAGVLVLDRVINTLFIAAVAALAVTPLARVASPEPGLATAFDRGGIGMRRGRMRYSGRRPLFDGAIQPVRDRRAVSGAGQASG